MKVQKLMILLPAAKKKYTFVHKTLLHDHEIKYWGGFLSFSQTYFHVLSLVRCKLKSLLHFCTYFRKQITPTNLQLRFSEIYACKKFNLKLLFLFESLLTNVFSKKYVSFNRIPCLHSDLTNLWVLSHIPNYLKLLYEILKIFNFTKLNKISDRSVSCVNS